MVLKVNNVNILPYVAYDEGIKWQRSDLEDPDAGRTLDGMMQRGRVASKIRLDITCRPLKSSEASIVLNAIFPEYRKMAPSGGMVLRSRLLRGEYAYYFTTLQKYSSWGSLL